MGIKNDQEKKRWDLVPFRALSSVVDVLTFGAKKYSDDNWQTVPNRERRYFAAALRHLEAWKLGEKLDAETGLPHLAHASCCVLFLLAEQVGFDVETLVPELVELEEEKKQEICKHKNGGLVCALIKGHTCHHATKRNGFGYTFTGVDGIGYSHPNPNDTTAWRPK